MTEHLRSGTSGRTAVGKPTVSMWRRGIRTYQTLAVLILNTLVLFALGNLAVWLVIRGHEWGPEDSGRRADPWAVVEQAETLAKIYPGMSREDVRCLRRETYRPLRFESFTMFRETPFSGKFVNVDVAGFRHGGDRMTWPPDPGMTNVFVFGGSTTFGYGVQDSETIPSSLQRALARAPCARTVRVYNFGRGYYYSTQERILFEELLARGHVPDIAIFIDGLNDSDAAPHEIPGFEARYVDLLPQVERRDNAWSDLVRLSQDIPMVHAAKWLRKTLSRRAEPSRPPGPDPAMDPRAQAAAVDRWLVNEMLSRAAGDARNVRVLLVWQPIPTYKYDLRYHVMRGTLTVPDPGTEFYTRMNARRAEGRLPNLLWLADIQEGRAGPLYVDELHYTGAFAATIANHIGEHLRALGWVCRSIPGDRK